MESHIIGWGGMQESEICNDLTNVPIQHWETGGLTECIALIDKRFNGYMKLAISIGKLFICVAFLCEFYLYIRCLVYLSLLSRKQLLYKKSNCLGNGTNLSNLQ